MGSISLKIEQRTFIGTLARAIPPSGRSIFGPLQWSKWRKTSGRRWTSISQLFKCSKDNPLSKWDIINDTNGNISISSRMVPLASPWVGANITWSTVSVPWRLIPADGKSYQWVWSHHICRRGDAASFAILFFQSHYGHELRLSESTSAYVAAHTSEYCSYYCSY